MPFQNITGNQFGQAGIPTAVAVLYKVPPNTRSYLKDIDIANNTPGDIQVTVYLVRAGGAPDPLGNVLVPNVTVPRYGQYQWTGTQIITDGGTIQMVASAIGCTINASGGEAL